MNPSIVIIGNNRLHHTNTLLGTLTVTMWVALGEMFPNQLRGSGLAQWISNFLITLTFPVLLVSLGLSFAYALYAFFALVSVFFVTRYFIETKGKELEEMDEVWS